jgi:hypothetical protein
MLKSALKRYAGWHPARGFQPYTISTVWQVQFFVSIMESSNLATSISFRSLYQR